MTQNLNSIWVHPYGKIHLLYCTFIWQLDIYKLFFLSTITQSLISLLFGIIGVVGAGIWITEVLMSVWRVANICSKLKICDLVSLYKWFWVLARIKGDNFMGSNLDLVIMYMPPDNIWRPDYFEAKKANPIHHNG